MSARRRVGDEGVAAQVVVEAQALDRKRPREERGSCGFVEVAVRRWSRTLLNTGLRTAALIVVGGACDDANEPKLPTKRVSSTFVFSRDAFSFANFGGIANGSAVSPEHMARMFGKDTVCVPSAGSVCHLTPIAKEYLRAVNDSIHGGRCEGFAVLSGLASRGEVDLAPFGADDARSLVLDGNRALGAEIAYWFATQYLRDVVPRSTTPTDAVGAVELLYAAFQKKDHPMYRIGMARLDEETGALSGGHAILATYVAPGDDEGRYVIGVYDNNHPDAEREIVVDAEKNSWTYQASTNPDDPTTVYAGDPDNGNVLFLATVEPRQGEHPCTFCSLDEDDPQALSQVFGSASTEIVAVHASGARVGEHRGHFVDEHEHGHVLPSFTAACHDCRDGMHLVVPHDGAEGTLLEIREALHAPIEDGERVPLDVRFFGHGFTTTVEGADVAGVDEVHLLDIEGGGDDVTFTSTPAEVDDVAVLSLAVEFSALEQVFVEARVQGSEVARLLVDPVTADATIRIEGATASGTTRMRVTRHSQDVVRTFSADVPTPAGARASIVVDDSQQGGDVVVLLDRDDDGVFEERLVLADLQVATEGL